MKKSPVKVGDLVRWHTESWVFESAAERYCSPGVVLKKKPSATFTTVSFQVLWADGKITDEHDAYLHPYGASEQ